MRRIKIHKPDMMLLSAPLPDAVSLFEMMHLVEPETKIQYCQRLKPLIFQSPLSDGFTLYAHVIFQFFYPNHRDKPKSLASATFYKTTQENKYKMLDAVGSIHLNALYHKAVTQCRPIERARAKILAPEETHSTEHTLAEIPAQEAMRSTDKRSTNNQQTFFHDQITDFWTLTRQLVEIKKQALARFLLLAKIILILEENKLLPEKTALKIKTEIIQDPIKFIQRIAPILNILQTVAVANPSEEQTNDTIDETILRQAIQMILKLLDIQNEQNIHSDIINKLLNDLIDKRILELVDSAINIMQQADAQRRPSIIF